MIIKQRDLLTEQIKGGIVVTNKITCGLNGSRVLDTNDIDAWHIEFLETHDSVRKYISHSELLEKMLPHILETRGMTNLSERVHFLRTKCDFYWRHFEYVHYVGLSYANNLNWACKRQEAFYHYRGSENDDKYDILIILFHRGHNTSCMIF